MSIVEKKKNYWKNNYGKKNCASYSNRIQQLVLQYLKGTRRVVKYTVFSYDAAKRKNFPVQCEKNFPIKWSKGV